MRLARVVGVLGLGLGVASAAWACSSFDETATGNDDAGEASVVASEAAADSPSPDATAPDSSTPTPDAGGPSPCPDGGGVVIFSSDFENGSGLAGWTPDSSGNATIAPTATDAGTVARSTITAKNTGVTYAVITRGSLSTHFAFRMSFSVSSLEDRFIFHQAIDPVFSNHLRLSLQTGGWTLGSVSGANVVLGDRGAAGDWHTITYRVEGAPDAGSQVSVKFDQTETSLDLGADSGVFATAQLGAFWPLPSSDPAQLVVDYDNVTAWDCTK